MLSVSPPHSIAELLERAQKLSGLTLQQIADQHHVATTLLHKGWIGQLMEIALGASAQSKPEPDFINLGVELKTLPLGKNNQPRESTFVCAIPKLPEVNWQGSLVQRKLATVLWIPIATDAKTPLLARRIGAPLLWRPTPEQEALLRQDWEELTELLMLGKADELTALQGQVLQVRPKAAHSRILRRSIDAEGNLTHIVPRGFYLRAGFTASIIQAEYLI